MSALCAPVFLTARQESSATIVFPAPTSPCSNLFMGNLLEISDSIRLTALTWLSVSLNGRFTLKLKSPVSICLPFSLNRSLKKFFFSRRASDRKSSSIYFSSLFASSISSTVEGKCTLLKSDITCIPIFGLENAVIKSGTKAIMSRSALIILRSCLG